ncbi:hypothetical protein PIB30_063096 [Stylosanthes scabra]|uniref:AAA+ ATPase domain-containing protein n=1 Tax=Stylosanthes scabra TaxID=79078 RepID=A0ABU6ZK26_9FABA|nr:hypothetical protein [Stylosanthes scabra]
MTRPMHGSLRRRLDSCKSTYSTVDDIVTHLRSTYPEYHRLKHQTLTRLVQRLLNPRPKHAPNVLKMMHGQEEQQEEEEAAAAQFSASTSCTSSSTSEDAILREDYEPAGVDLMKTMLRKAYTPSKTKPVVEDKIVELEFANNSKDTNDSVKEKEKAGPRFSDFGGMKDTLEDLLYKTSAAELVSGVSGASEENVPSIIFIDEIDSIASKRENYQRGMEQRIVGQLLACMDQSNKDYKGHNVVVIAATNRPHALDSALRRPGRFDWEIFMDIPDEAAREHILSLAPRDVPLEGSLDLKYIARSTPGYVGADLEALVNEACVLAIKRYISGCGRFKKCELETSYLGDWWKKTRLLEDVDKLFCTMPDFQEALKNVQPSLTREGFSSVPNEKWEDIGGLDYLREEFKSKVIGPIKYPEAYKEFGLASQMGILLFGPPGCGKTLTAKAVANDAGANFIYIKGPELLSKFVGESERQVRLLFSRARACSPCIIFFDEVDGLSAKRDMEGGSGVERVVTQLLAELDGAQGVIVIGATNRPDKMDGALLRSGRFGKKFYIPLPSFEQRFSILKVLARKKPVDSTVDLRAIAKACENFSGADLAELMDEAGFAAVNEKLSLDQSLRSILARHFDIALSKVIKSVSPEERRSYEVLADQFKASR